MTEVGLSPPRVLVVGVGQMGSGMAHRCIEAGLEVRVIDVDAAASANFKENCTTVHDFIASVATFSIALICVVNAAQAHEVLFGEPEGGLHFHHGLALKLRPGSTVLVTSTISVTDMQAIGTRLGALGLQMLDAPVSGGPVRARDGSMSMMLAGSADALRCAQPALDAMSRAQTVVGAEIGMATTAKLLNNALATVHLYNHAQALAASDRLGLPGSLLQSVVNSSSGQSWIGGHRGQRYLSGQRIVQARMALLAKDSALALEMLRSQGLATDWLEPAASAFSKACAAGWQDRDDSELIAWVAEAGI